MGKNSLVIAVLLASCFTVVLAGCNSGESCQQVVAAKCMRCHSVATTCAKIGESEARWQDTLDAMVKLGADVTPQERKTLTKCLSNPAGKQKEGACQ
jgi:hypothetical protein